MKIPLIPTYKFATAAVLSFSSQVLHANEWESQFDLLTAGAASSVVLFQVCRGDAAARQAAQMASNMLIAAANSTSYAAEAYQYAKDAYSLKVKAIWQSSSGFGCEELSRLRDMARGTGFATP